MGVFKHCSGEREKEVRRSGTLHRGKSTVMGKDKKEEASTSQLEKDTGIL